jgi:hypothetical protein
VDAALLLALLLALPAVLPLTAPGYFFNAHDAHHSVFWLVEFDQTLRAGSLWPIWAPDHALGFGYPLWLIYAPLPFIVAEAFHLAGLGFTAAVKATWALGFFLGALGIYRVAQRWWGSSAALVASLVFTYAPYHLAQIYVRADLAEFMAWSWFPWAFLAVDLLWDDPRPRRLACAALALGALLYLHTVSPLIFAPFLAAYFLYRLVRERRLQPAALRPALWVTGAAALGVLLAVAFLVPGVVEQRFLSRTEWLNPNYDYWLHFVYPNQFLSPFWGFGASLPGPDSGMSFQLGALAVLGGAAGCLAGLAASKTRLPHRREVLFLAVATLVAIFLMTGYSAPLWSLVPLVGTLMQFPWRLLALTMVTLALLSGAAVYWLDAAGGRPPGSAVSAWACLAGLAVVLASFSYTRPQLQPIRPDDESPLAVIEFETTYPDMRGMTAWAQHPPLDADSPLLREYLAGLPLQRAAVLAGSGQVVAQGTAPASAWARITAGTAVRLRFYTYYFPGWSATVDGRPAAITPDPPNGLIGLSVPAGQHMVQVRFGPTPIRNIAGAISLVALAAVALLLLIPSFGRSRTGML